MGQRGLHEQDGAEDVDFVLRVEEVGAAGFDRHVAADAGVVDDDVDLKRRGLGVGEVVPGRGDDVGGAVGVAQVGLDRDGFDGVAFFELLGQGGGARGRGGGGVI